MPMKKAMSLPLPAHDLGFGFQAIGGMPAFVSGTLLESSHKLHNRDHDHLAMADVGFIWAGALFEKKGRVVLGQARLGEPSGSDVWAKERQRSWLESVLGRVPDFIVTLYGPWWRTAREIERLALLEHELAHCAQAVDQWGAPRFTREGRPKWWIRPHDFEEFSMVIRRYGLGAVAGGDSLKRAIEAGPEISEAVVNGLCGTCLRKVA